LLYDLPIHGPISFALVNSQLLLIVETERPKNGLPPGPTVVHPVYLQTAGLKLIFTISLKYLDRGFVAKFLSGGFSANRCLGRRIPEHLMERAAFRDRLTQFSAMFATQLNIPGLWALQSSLIG
jgi:hypothetical protein